MDQNALLGTTTSNNFIEGQFLYPRILNASHCCSNVGLLNICEMSVSLLKIPFKIFIRHCNLMNKPKMTRMLKIIFLALCPVRTTMQLVASTTSICKGKEQGTKKSDSYVRPTHETIRNFTTTEGGAFEQGFTYVVYDSRVVTRAYLIFQHYAQRVVEKLQSSDTGFRRSLEVDQAEQSGTEKKNDVSLRRPHLRNKVVFSVGDLGGGTGEYSEFIRRASMWKQFSHGKSDMIRDRVGTHMKHINVPDLESRGQRRNSPVKRNLEHQASSSSINMYSSTSLLNSSNIFLQAVSFDFNSLCGMALKELRGMVGDRAGMADKGNHDVDCPVDQQHFQTDKPPLKRKCYRLFSGYAPSDPAFLAVMEEESPIPSEKTLHCFDLSRDSRDAEQPFNSIKAASSSLALSSLRELNKRVLSSITSTSFDGLSSSASSSSDDSADNSTTAIRTPGLRHQELRLQHTNLPVFDFVLSLEVGEHIPPEKESIFLDNLAGHALYGIILSWAIPGQDGSGHVNLHENDYIVGEMKKRGFEINWELSDMLRETSWWPWFKNTIMVFFRAAEVGGSLKPE